MAELKIGSTLQNGKYEITKVLGSGNFGITYLATTKISVNGQLGQMDVAVNVAIKEFYMKDLNSRTSDGSTVEGTQNTMVKNYRTKFKKEAENLAKLHHPNIVKVIEVFDENNTTYYVMEYVEGGSLDDYIKLKGRLTEEEALKCTLEIADALSYMHKNMMIHLDLKPKNIMRNSKGHLYLIDFGLSKQYDENGEPESSTSIGLGTPGYAPLEQASYKQDGTLPVTLDVYALGASLYKMLTGMTPPESSSVLNEGLPLTYMKRLGVSEGAIAIVEKAMAPVKTMRYQSIADIMQIILEYDLSENDEATVIEAKPLDNKFIQKVSRRVLHDNTEKLTLHDGPIPILSIIIWCFGLCMSAAVFIMSVRDIVNGIDSSYENILTGTIFCVMFVGLILMLLKKMGGFVMTPISTLAVYLLGFGGVSTFLLLLWTVCLLFFVGSLLLKIGNHSAWQIVYKANTVSILSLAIWSLGFFLAAGFILLSLDNIINHNGEVQENLITGFAFCIIFLGLFFMMLEKMNGLVAVIIGICVVFAFLIYIGVPMLFFLWMICVLVFIGSLILKKSNMTVWKILNSK